MKKKLKSAFLKLKHWLIRKLGGYVVQECKTSSIVSNTLTVKPMVFTAEIRVPDWWVYERQGRYPTQAVLNEIKQRLAAQFINNLMLNESAYTIRCCDDPLHNEQVYRAEFYLIDSRTFAKWGVFGRGFGFE